MQVWYRLLPVSESERPDRLLEALHEAGAEPLLSIPSATPSQALIIFSSYRPEVERCIHETKQAGAQWIIALGLSRSSVSTHEAWGLLRAGASDVLTVENDIAQAAQAITSRLRRWQKIAELVGSPLVRNAFVCQSHSTVATLHHLVETAHFTGSTALLMGESGTGKELAARLIHALDQRQNKGTLVLLDCTTVVPELSGSEFFGHERGAFTGAASPRDGAFALAHRGTLFLDEVGELPIGLQGQLLRVIQERSYKRVGGNIWHETDFRLVCATNRDLLQEVEQGRFRSDLYYRIASEVIHIPPLRERPGDILPLAHRFATEFHNDRLEPEFDETVEQHLLVRPYPGNVRELRHLMARIMGRYTGPGPITVGCLPEEDRPCATDHEARVLCDTDCERWVRRAVALGIGLKEIGRTAENIAVNFAVSDAAGNLQRAAEKLKVTDRALQLRRATNSRPVTEGDSNRAG